METPTTTITLRVTEEERELILSLLDCTAVGRFAKENFDIDMEQILARTYPKLALSSRHRWWDLAI